MSNEYCGEVIRMKNHLEQTRKDFFLTKTRKAVESCLKMPEDDKDYFAKLSFWGGVGWGEEEEMSNLMMV